MLFYCGFYKIFLRFRVWWGFTRWGWEGRGGTKKIQRKRWASQIATVVFIHFIMFATVVYISPCLHPGPLWARVPGLETADSWGSGFQLNSLIRIPVLFGHKWKAPYQVTICMCTTASFMKTLYILSQDSWQWRWLWEINLWYSLGFPSPVLLACRLDYTSEYLLHLTSKHEKTISTLAFFWC